MGFYPSEAMGQASPAESAEHFSAEALACDADVEDVPASPGRPSDAGCNAAPVRSFKGLGARRAPAAVLEAAGATALR